MNPLLPPEASSPPPDALRAFDSASPGEQLRRTRVVLEHAGRMHGRRVASLAGCLFLLERTPDVPPEPVTAARRLLCAVAGDANLRRWELEQPRAAVRRALQAAIAFARRGAWLELVGGAP